VRRMKHIPLKRFEADVEAVFREAERAPVMITKAGRSHLVVLSISEYRRLGVGAKRNEAVPGKNA
jgi:prevent-host-death family protein